MRRRSRLCRRNYFSGHRWSKLCRCCSKKNKSMKDELRNKLVQILEGEPWYGKNTYDILSEVKPQTAYISHFDAHSIAEIVLHLTAWTEEVAERLQNKLAGLPARGDWPAVNNFNFLELIRQFKAANEYL